MSLADDARVAALLRALQLTGQGIVLTIDGEPYPKPRPRFDRARRRTYTDKKAEARELATRYELYRRVPEPLDGNLALVCIFYRSTAHVVDVDNLLKHVCDAANGVLWHDDSQVTALTGVLELDRDAPRTVIALGPHRSSLVRQRKPDPEEAIRG